MVTEGYIRVELDVNRLEYGLKSKLRHFEMKFILYSW